MQTIELQIHFLYIGNNLLFIGECWSVVEFWSAYVEFKNF